MSIIVILITAIIALLTFLLYHEKRKLNYWRDQQIPHMKPSLIVGNFQGLRKTHSMAEILTEHYQKFKASGPFSGFYFIHRPSVVVLDPNLMKSILIKDFQNFTDRGLFNNEKDDPLTGRLFLLDGAEWKNMRSKLSPTFSSGKMKAMYSLVQKEADKLVKILNEMISKNSEMEIKDIMARFTTDVIGSCAFGIQCNSLEDPQAEFRLMGLRSLNERRHGPLISGFMQGFPDLARKLHMCMTPQDITDFFIRIVKEVVEYREKNNVKSQDFLGILSEIKKDSGNQLSIEQMAAQAFVFFLGGFETSSSTLGFALYELALQTDIQDKLRQEIREAYKDNVIDYESLHQLKYMGLVIKDSCVAGNKSPRASGIYSKPLPFQQKLSPAEQQYESYVKATVAANAKSPVEELLSPPEPPPRRHTLTAKLSLSSSPTAVSTSVTDGTVTSKSAKASESPLVSPSKEAAAAAASSADAQTLFNIRQQMALSLKRMKDLEEQVKAIPDLQSELSQLREEKMRLQQTVKTKEEELQKAKEATRFSSSPSPILSPKIISSPVQFQPQRVSPISLESMGARMQASSTGLDRNSKSSPILKRDVGTMYNKQTTRDIAVGSPIPNHKLQRDVACNAAVTKSIHENLFTKIEVEQRIEMSIRKYEEQKKLDRLKDLVTVGTQMYVTKTNTKESGAQTSPEKKVLKHNVSLMAQPTTRESYTSCRPDVRSVGSSNDRVTDVLCEKCVVTKRSVACATEDELKEESAKIKLLDMPARSNTFSLGDNEKLNIARKTTGTQYTPLEQSTTASQTSALLQHSIAVQFNPTMQNSGTQFEIDTSSRQTDTRDLIRLSNSLTNTEEISPPTPIKEKKLEPPKPVLLTKASNTEVKNFKELGVNTQPPATTSSTSCNTEEIHKRDIACGDIVKPHISIACADNYCDSCKDAIKNLAKDFSKVLASPQPTRAAESKIPRPKNLPSPSPVRRQFSRQNTYTVTPSPTPSPVSEKKSMASSLQEKSSASLQQLESSGESQCFISQPVSLTAVTTEKPKPSEEEEKLSSSNASPGNSSPRKSLYDLSQLGDNELIVREEKRVSISWSRDNSPAPVAAAAVSPKSTGATPKQIKEEPSQTATSKEISQGARKKTTLPLPLKSSHESKSADKTAEEEELPQKPLPSKALLQKIAMKETEPRKKIPPPKEMLTALKTINNSLLKKLGSKPISSFSLKAPKQTIQTEWFRLSSSETADPNEVEDYLDCFEELSVPLLEYCVNMVDSNGNTAMHYAVSYGNFDVVSILLDSKVCNVNQMNNAGYTSVMLVSLAKLKSAEHRTVVERLFQMADVNIRAKKHCQTALMLAVSHGNLEMVQMLLNAGADINIQDEDGSTALMCAAEHGRSDIVKHLLTHPDCDSLIQDVDGSTAFKIAWQAGHRDIGIFLYVHEQMMRSKMPNRGENLLAKRSPPSTSPRYTHKRQPSK